jgi:hypothetical protein
MAEQDYRGGISLAEKRARLLEARAGLAYLCDVLGIELTEARRSHLGRLDYAALDELRRQLMASRAWPREG